MFEKIIEVYAAEQKVLDLSRPAFDIRFHQGGQIDGVPLDARWNELQGRIVFDIREQLHPRGKLNDGSARAVSEMRALTQKYRLPPPFLQELESAPYPERELRSFEQMLEWLEKELKRYQLSFRVTRPNSD